MIHFHLNFSQSVGEKLKAAKTDGDAIQILQVTAKCGKSKSDYALETNAL